MSLHNPFRLTFATLWRALGAAFVLAAALPLATAGRVQAAVAYAAVSANSSATSGGTGVNLLDLTIATPSGLAVNDLMVASAQFVLKTANATTVDATAPAGWTALSNNNQTGWAVELWWKRATAADVSAANVTFTAAFTNRNATAAGVITTYRGVAPTGSPINWGPDKRTGFNATVVANGVYGIASPSESGSGYASTPGSLGVGIVMADRSGNSNPVDLSLTSGMAGALVAHQGATGGGGVDGINTAVAYAAPNASGVYPGAGSYIGMTATATIQWTAFSFVLEPAPPCGLTGQLGITAPGSFSFPSTALTGGDVTLATSAAFVVDDGTTTDGTTSSGWNLQMTASQFTSGGNTLPASSLSVQSASDADAGGRCSAPTSLATYPLTVPAGAATKVYRAAANTGRGASTITLNLRLAVPARTRIGTYTSTWTATLASGP